MILWAENGRLKCLWHLNRNYVGVFQIIVKFIVVVIAIIVAIVVVIIIVTSVVNKCITLKD